jgi:hypothetical protein
VEKETTEQPLNSAAPDAPPAAPVVSPTVSNSLVKGLAPWADVFSKGIAGLAIALYASGFLVLSLYHSKFGFVGTNPFRPSVLAAGAWFLIFTTIPIPRSSVALLYFSDKIADSPLVQGGIKKAP